MMTYQPISLLDHGYVRLVEHWGSDKRIIEAARMSTQKGFNGWGSVHSKNCHLGHSGLSKQHNTDCCPDAAGDEKLLAYLWKNNHVTPFEMAGLIIEVQAPIFVFREWHRHRTQSYNEMSARYAPLPDMNYVPTVERCLANGGTNKQAGAIKNSEELHSDTAKSWQEDLEELYTKAEELYQFGLNRGVPKELARLCLPVGRYSRMRASANLRNWLAFLTLRNAPNAQQEIREYAAAVERLVAELFPRSWDVFRKLPLS